MASLSLSVKQQNSENQKREKTKTLINLERSLIDSPPEEGGFKMEKRKQQKIKNEKPKK